MKYEIKGDTLPVVILTLETGEKIHSEAGAMSWMSESIEMTTNAGGSLGKVFSRAFSGESIFQNVYKAKYDGDFIAFSSSFPGVIIPVDVTNRPIIAQKSAFLAREDGVNMSIHFQRKIEAESLYSACSRCHRRGAFEAIMKIENVLIFHKEIRTFSIYSIPKSQLTETLRILASSRSS